MQYRFKSNKHFHSVSFGSFHKGHFADFKCFKCCHNLTFCSCNKKSNLEVLPSNRSWRSVLGATRQQFSQWTAKKVKPLQWSRLLSDSCVFAVVLLNRNDTLFGWYIRCNVTSANSFRCFLPPPPHVHKNQRDAETWSWLKVQFNLLPREEGGDL